MSGMARKATRDYSTPFQGMAPVVATVSQDRRHDLRHAQVQLALSTLQALILPQVARCLADGIARYEEEELPRLARNTQERQRRELSRLMDRLGGEDISADYRGHVRKLYAEFPRSTASLLGSMVRRLLTLAYSEWKWRTEPHGLGNLATVKARPRQRVFADGERPKLEVSISSSRFHPPAIEAARFVLLTGVRVSEACALRWADVAEDCSTVRIGVTKTKRPRTINLSAECRDLLCSIARVSEYVFPGRWTTRPVSRGTVGKVVRLAAKEAGLEGVCVHTARHDWASVAMRLGVPDPIAEAHLGASVAVLRKHYQHARPDDVREAVERVSLVVKATR